MRRVVVTGIGMCSPLGYGVEHSWSQLLKSKSGIRELSGFDTTNLSSQVGGQIPKEGNSDLFPEKVIEIKEEKKMEPFIQFALIAAKEAISKALGTGIGRGFGFRDLFVRHDELGRPVVRLNPENKVLSDALPCKIHLSISDDHSHAIAFCTIES